MIRERSWMQTAGLAGRLLSLGTAMLVGLASVGLGAGRAGAASPGTGPIAYYSFDETSGDVAQDSVRGAAGDGTLFGFSTPGWVTGKSGNALQFNGSSTYVRAPMLTGPLSGATVAAWVKLNGFTQWMSFVKNWGVLPGAFHFGTSETDLSLSNFIGLDDNSQIGVVGPQLQLGQWYYVAVTFDNTTQRLYVDNVLVASESVPPGHTISQNFPNFMSFGVKLDDNQTGPAPSWALPGYLDGVMDELIFYDRALSVEELTAAASGQLPGVTPTPTATAAAATATPTPSGAVLATYSGNYTGDLNGNAITVLGGTASAYADLTDSATYCPPGTGVPPLGDRLVTFSNLNADVSISFASPVTNLNVYAPFFRSNDNSGPAKYTFTPVGGTCSWSIQSGFSNSSLVGNDLTVNNGSSFDSGVLRCAGTISGLTLTTTGTNPASSGYDLVTFGLGDCAAASTPTPTATAPAATPTAGTSTVFATWGAANTGAGVLNGTSFTWSGNGLLPGLSLTEGDFSCPTFDPPSSTGVQDELAFKQLTNPLSFTFASAVTNLNVYVDYWKSPSNKGPTKYTLTPVGGTCIWSIQSGLTNSSVSGNDLTIDSGLTGLGVLRCAGTITGLNLTAPGGDPTNFSDGYLTFSVGDAPSCGAATPTATPTPTATAPAATATATAPAATATATATPVPSEPTPTSGPPAIRGNKTNPARDRRGCQTQWKVPSLAAATDRYGLGRWTQNCVDGDPACDQDPTPGVCGFDVVVCLNNADPSLPLCPASGIREYRVREPWVWARSNKPESYRQIVWENRSNLQGALHHLADPANTGAGFNYTAPLDDTQRGFCSDSFRIRVPVTIATRKPLSGLMKLSVTTVSQERRGRSTLRLVCESRP